MLDITISCGLLTLWIIICLIFTRFPITISDLLLVRSFRCFLCEENILSKHLLDHERAFCFLMDLCMDYTELLKGECSISTIRNDISRSSSPYMVNTTSSPDNLPSERVKNHVHHNNFIYRRLIDFYPFCKQKILSNMIQTFKIC